MQTLSEKLLELTEQEKESVSRKPKTESERGYQMAILRMCAIIRKEIISHQKDRKSSTYTKEEFLSFLNKLEEEHGEN